MKAELYDRLRRHLDAGELVASATVVAGPGLGRQMLVRPGGETFGELGSPALEEAVLGAAERGFGTFASGRLELEAQGEAVEVFLEIHPPRPKLVLVGAVHTAIPLVTFARELGFTTYVVDPRRAFATPERFAHADRLIHAWPQEALPEIGLDESSCVAVLSHDLKIDLPALKVALASPARYIGALGSKKTHAKRVQALREEGFGDGDLARVRSPIGLDLGGRRPEEIAVAIIAEIVAAGHGRPPGKQAV